MTKIVQVISYYPPHLGGMEKIAHSISKGLVKRGYDVEVYTSNLGTKKGKLKSTERLNINYLNAWEFAHTAIIPSLFNKLMKIPRDSIMHVHLAQAFVPEVVYLVSKIRGIPYVLHYHADTLPSGKFGFLLKPYKALFLKRILRNASSTIVLNELYRDFLKNKYKTKGQIKVIPTYVNKDFFVKSRKRKNKVIKLLYVGRLSKEKNIDLLIRSLDLIKNKAQLIIIGEGEERKNLEKLNAQNSKNKAIFLGQKDSQELVEIYRNADIALLASNREGLPLFLLEAMAAGVPIIASKAPGITELVGNVGILVNPINPVEFAKQIDNLINNPKNLSKFSIMGKSIAQNFTENKMIQNTEQVYREVLNETRKK